MNSHLNGIGVSNFRIFQHEQNFNFAPITILTGTNSSGKSNLINLLTLLKETFQVFNSSSRKIGDKDLFRDLPQLSEQFIYNTFGNFSKLPNNKNHEKKWSFSTIDIDLPGYENSILLSVKYNYNLAPTYSSLRSIEISIKSVIDTEIVKYFKTFLKKYELQSIEDLNNLVLFELSLDDEDQVFDNIICKGKYDVLYLLYLSYRMYYLEVVGQIILYGDMLLEENNNATEEIEIYAKKHNVKFNVVQIKDEEKLKVGILFENITGFEKSEIKEGFFTRKIHSKPDDKYFYSSKSGRYYVSKIDDLTFINEWCDNEENKIKLVNNLLKPHYKSEDTFYCQIRFQAELLKLISDNIHYTDNIFNYLNTIRNHKDQIFTNDSTVEDKILFTPFIIDILFPFLEIIKDKIDANKESFKISYPSQDLTFEDAFFKKMINGTYQLIFKKLQDFKYITLTKNNRAIDQRQYKIKNTNELNLFKNFNHNTTFREILKKYILDLEIAEDIKFEIDEEIMMCKILLVSKGKEINLKDEGFGISKLIPLLLAIQPEYDRFESQLFEKAYYSPVIMLIEEPESNLHPALQSKLADLFIDLSDRFNIQFIIETHSEYIIRKLQYRTAKKEIATEDTQIYYFHHPDRIPEGEKQIYPINIRKDGSLTKNFGTGFFDEASNIALELFLLKNEQQN